LVGREKYGRDKGTDEAGEERKKANPSNRVLFD